MQYRIHAVVRAAHATCSVLRQFALGRRWHVRRSAWCACMTRPTSACRTPAAMCRPIAASVRMWSYARCAHGDSTCSRRSTTTCVSTSMDTRSCGGCPDPTATSTIDACPTRCVGSNATDGIRASALQRTISRPATSWRGNSPAAACCISASCRTAAATTARH